MIESQFFCVTADEENKLDSIRQMQFNPNKEELRKPLNNVVMLWLDIHLFMALFMRISLIIHLFSSLLPDIKGSL